MQVTRWNKRINAVSIVLRQSSIQHGPQDAPSTLPLQLALRCSRRRTGASRRNLTRPHPLSQLSPFALSPSLLASAPRWPAPRLRRRLAPLHVSSSSATAFTSPAWPATNASHAAAGGAAAHGLSLSLGVQPESTYHLSSIPTELHRLAPRPRGLALCSNTPSGRS